MRLTRGTARYLSEYEPRWNIEDRIEFCVVQVHDVNIIISTWEQREWEVVPKKARRQTKRLRTAATYWGTDGKFRSHLKNDVDCIRIARLEPNVHRATNIKFSDGPKVLRRQKRLIFT